MRKSRVALGVVLLAGHPQVPVVVEMDREVCLVRQAPHDLAGRVEAHEAEVLEVEDDVSVGHHDGAVDVAVLVLDRVLLALIVGELLYTLRFVVRTHEIAVEPFLYIGLIAVVRRILIVTAQFERSPQTGRALTNTLLEFGLLGLMVPAMAAAIWLVRRSRRLEPAMI